MAQPAVQHKPALDGQVAIITGGGTGIGRACALAFAAEGARVAVNYSRSREAAEQTAAECAAAGGEGMAIQADVSHPAEIEALVAQTLERWQQVDVLVNNAGTTTFAAYDDLHAMTEAVWDRLLAVNVKAVFFACRAVAPHMKRAGRGSIVNVASIAGLRPVGSSVAYCASKAAALSVTQTLATALAPEIRVNAIAPGFIETRWHEGREEAARGTQAQTPLRRNGTPEDVAQAALFLAASGSFVTGEIIVVDGGRFLR